MQTITSEQCLRTDSPWPPASAHRGPGHRPWVTDARSPAPRAPPPACPRFSPAESAPHMSHVTNSLCGGEFLRVSRGTGPQGAAPPSVQGTRSDPHSPGVHTAGSRVRDGHGAYRLCCGLACGDDARAPRHRASGPRRPLPAPRVRRHEQSWPNCGMLGHVSLTSRATRTPKRRRAKTPTRTAGRLKRQNHQNSRHRAETKRSTRAKSEEASAAFRLSRVHLAPSRAT
jgi:hypothetical protein